MHNLPHEIIQKCSYKYVAFILKLLIINKKKKTVTVGNKMESRETSEKTGRNESMYYFHLKKNNGVCSTTYKIK